MHVHEVQQSDAPSFQLPAAADLLPRCHCVCVCVCVRASTWWPVVMAAMQLQHVHAPPQTQ